ncbi:MAG: hypothetical protein KAV82_06480, partial [Phycisphaerae bacterium]|nr:hypothetical protein [Phycisphaerae bacterium]
AQSLAALARENAGLAQFERAAEPLRARLAAADAGDIRLRGALLAAMANIGSEQFAAEFETHLGEEHAELLLPAIRGIVAVQDDSRMNRLRGLFLHPDARVRLQAIEAVGILGDGEAPLETLANHLSLATESNEAARSAAWEAFCKILKRQPAETRLRWADRLKELPGRRIEYLTILVDDLAVANSVPDQLNEARRRLALLLREQKRYAESARHLQELYASLPGGDDLRAGEVGVLLLDSLLRNGHSSTRLETLLPELAVLGEDTRAEVVRTITVFLNEAMPGKPDPNLAALAEQLRQAGAGLYGPAFDEFLGEVITKSTPAPTTGPAKQSRGKRQEA